MSLKYLLVILFFPSMIFAQTLDSYQRKEFVLNGDTLKYRIHFPENYDAKKKYPVITYLHGSGERGSDNETPITIGGQFFISKPNNAYDYITIFPQCPANQSWRHLVENPDSTKHAEFDISFTKQAERPSVLVKSLLDQLQKDKVADPSQMYIGGSSMGGFGTFDMVERYPNYFAAAFPICGGGDVAKAGEFANKVSVWIFHGAEDNVVYPERSRVYYKKLKELGAD
ncbi:MAG TPA: alpha/beta hydrolase-fold protein, partial [Cytophagaceae bacterium]